MPPAVIRLGTVRRPLRIGYGRSKIDGVFEVAAERRNSSCGLGVVVSRSLSRRKAGDLFGAFAFKPSNSLSTCLYASSFPLMALYSVSSTLHTVS